MIELLERVGWRLGLEIELAVGVAWLTERLPARARFWLEVTAGARR